MDYYLVASMGHGMVGKKVPYQVARSAALTVLSLDDVKVDL